MAEDAVRARLAEYENETLEQAYRVDRSLRTFLRGAGVRPGHARRVFFGVKQTLVGGPAKDVLGWIEEKDQIPYEKLGSNEEEEWIVANHVDLYPPVAETGDYGDRYMVAVATPARFIAEFESKAQGPTPQSYARMSLEADLARRFPRIWLNNKIIHATLHSVLDGYALENEFMGYPLATYEKLHTARGRALLRQVLFGRPSGPELQEPELPEPELPQPELPLLQLELEEAIQFRLPPDLLEWAGIKVPDLHKFYRTESKKWPASLLA